MTSWLDPLRSALDGAGQPVEVFFRDDDAGWDDERLWLLCDRFDAAQVPLDVAVIPAELRLDLANRLQRRAADGGRLFFHQHGWAHVDHEDAGRKHEFGPARTADEQRRDLRRGRAVMVEALGDDSVVCFVPPWNRCTEVTARLLLEEGFEVLCRDITAAPVDVPGLQEVPVTVDWSARRRGQPVDRAGRGELLAAAAARGRVGVMLHHAVTGEQDLRDLDELLRLVSSHPSVALRSMDQLHR